ncbi:MAG TPA: hypothetical protein VLZ83_03955 [Edaphocola sp.]|nr:hypothetical protein [Edaphocola sp.]
MGNNKKPSEGIDKSKKLVKKMMNFPANINSVTIEEEIKLEAISEEKVVSLEVIFRKSLGNAQVIFQNKVGIHNFSFEKSGKQVLGSYESGDTIELQFVLIGEGTADVIISAETNPSTPINISSKTKFKLFDIL